MSDQEFFEQLRKFDTPTICNALEIVRGVRFTTGFTTQTLIAAFLALPPIVGYARTATVRCSSAFDGSAQREKRLAYYEYVAQPKRPSVAVVQDIDHRPGFGAFWGEVNTNVHWGLGCVGAVTNGSMRDLDAMCPQFQCIAASLTPSHALIHLLDFGKPVDVCGLVVADGDIIHADRHGAVAIRQDELEKLPQAIDLMARREKVILEAARAPGFDVAKLREAFVQFDKVK
jgi:regulator of RNase E activity RraA